jgi:hypothetical protein
MTDTVTSQNIDLSPWDTLYRRMIVMNLEVFRRIAVVAATPGHASTK